MKKSISLILAAAVLAGLLVLAIAGCGGKGSTAGYGSGGAQTEKPVSQTGSVSINVDKNPKIGPILVDSKGNTLYLFKKDKGTKSFCYGACAGAWPPVTTSESGAKAGSGASSSLLGTTKRNDGTTQVTYNGWPLYLYAGDSKPGDINGNDFSQFGAQWYALTPSGEEAQG